MSTDEYTVREMKFVDWTAVLNIYQAGIDTQIATFREVPPTWEQWDGAHLKKGRFVAVSSEGDVVGFIALSPTSVKEAYRGVCEVSVYVAPSATGRGIGTLLLHQEIEHSETDGIWTLLSLIIEKNTASLHLHEHCGFRVVGVRERPAQMIPTGIWHNVVHMERRSEKVGK